MSVISMITALTSAGAAVSKSFEGLINYNLTQAKKVSGGIYGIEDQAGVKLATLFNMEQKQAGKQSAFWNGKDDYGKELPAGRYKAKIHKSNNSSSVIGAVGNSSLDIGSIYRHQSYPRDMYFTSIAGYFPAGYSEAGAVQKQFAINEPNVLTTPRYGKTTQSSFNVCVDEVQGIAYWGGYGGERNDSWVFGQFLSANGNPDAGIVPFTAGVFINEDSGFAGRLRYDYAIALIEGDAAARTKSMDVQQGQNKFLFITRSNYLQVLNNTTGALLQKITLNNPGKIRCVGDNKIWIVEDQVVNLYQVNPNGTLGAVLKSIPAGVSACVDFSPLTGEIAVSNNTDVQVKFYDPNTLELKRTFAVFGGISLTASLDYNKFSSIDFLRFQPDGKFWVGDTQNNRTVCLNNDFTYVNEISSFDFVRCVQVDQNDPTALFLAKREFKIDYSKLKLNQPGCWKLVANWSKGTDLDSQTEFTFIVTLANGIRYGGGGEQKPNLYKFTPQGTVLLSAGFPYTIQADGSIYRNLNYGDQFMNIEKADLIGFDENDMPLFSSFQVAITTPTMGKYEPWYFYNDTRYQSKTSDCYLFFNCWIGAVPDSEPKVGFVAGALRKSDNKVMWKSGRVTTPDFMGDLLKNGDYSLGAAEGHNNTRGYVNGDYFHYNVNTEFGSYGQSNLWNVIHIPTGLHVNQYGKTGLEGGKGLAGNALINSVVTIGNDTFTFCADESVSGGALTILSQNNQNVEIEEIDILLEHIIEPVNDSANISQSLPFYSKDFKAGNLKWFVDPITAADALIRTSYYTYQPDDIDLVVGGIGRNQVRGILSDKQLLKWDLSIDIMMPNSNPTIAGDKYNYVELLDQSKALIARFQVFADTQRDPYYVKILCNDYILREGGIYDQNIYNVAGIGKYFKSLKISYKSEVLTVSFDNEAFVVINKSVEGANLLRPGFIQINQASTGSAYPNLVSLNQIYFK